MYIWKSQQSPENLICTLQAMQKKSIKSWGTPYSFEIKDGSTFSLAFRQITKFGKIPFRCCRILKGTIREKGTGSEIAACFKIETFDKIGYSIFIVFMLSLGVYSIVCRDSVAAAVFSFFLALYSLVVMMFSRGNENALMEFISKAANSPAMRRRTARDR